MERKTERSPRSDTARSKSGHEDPGYQRFQEELLEYAKVSAEMRSVAGKLADRFMDKVFGSESSDNWRHEAEAFRQGVILGAMWAIGDEREGHRLSIKSMDSSPFRPVEMPTESVQ
jgi:hypothetical protein